MNTRLTWAPIVTGVSSCVVTALADSISGTPEGFRACLLTPQGNPMPWDDCVCGQFTSTIGPVFGSDSFPSPAVAKTWKRCGPGWVVATVTIQVVRCVPTATSGGVDVVAPTCDELLAAAIAQDSDRSILFSSLACCLQALADATPPIIGGYSIGPVETLPETGGCGGLQVAYQISQRGCLCPGQT